MESLFNFFFLLCSLILYRTHLLQNYFAHNHHNLTGIKLPYHSSLANLRNLRSFLRIPELLELLLIENSQN